MNASERDREYTIRSSRFLTSAAATLVVGVAACNADGSADEKSRGDATPLTPRLGTGEPGFAPYGHQVEVFAQSVMTL
jgi:hypothetical protein